MPHASRPEVRREHHFGAAKRVPTLCIEDAKGKPLALTRGIATPLRLQEALLEAVCLQFLPGDEMGGPLPSAWGRLVLFTGELPLMVVKHVEISPCLSLLSVCSRLALDLD